MNTKFLKITLFIATIILFASCDKDINDIGAGIVGDEHFGFTSDNTSTVEAYTQKTGAIQSNNLDVNALGIYDNPQFGKTTASYVTQVQMAQLATTINPILNQEIESVELYIPYFSKIVSTNSDGSNVYKLDSITGNIVNKMKLSVYENGYFLRNLDLDASVIEGQRFYSDQNSNFDGYKIGTRLNDDSTHPEQNDAFAFSASEFSESTITSGVTTTTRKAPGMKLNLNIARFKDLLFTNSNSGANLLNNAVFNDYFKGLYFKTEQIGSDQILAMMNFRKGSITVKYKEDASLTDHTVANRIDKTFILNLTGNSVSLLTNDFGTSGTTYGAISTAPVSSNDDKLYIKGGEGSVGIIKLFGADLHGVDGLTGTPNGVADELDKIRNSGWLINEASLTFYIDETSMANSFEPNRVFLYDATNKRPMIDYYFDGTTSPYVNYSKYVFGGLKENNTTTGRGEKYKVRITNYLRNLVKYKDSTNVRLGVCLTQAIGNTTIAKLKNANTVTYAPAASVMNPLGTILWGNTVAVPEAKKLKLEIWYTKPE